MTIKHFSVVWLFMVYIGAIIMFGKQLPNSVHIIRSETSTTTQIKVDSEKKVAKKTTTVITHTIKTVDPTKDKLKEVAKKEASNYGFDPDTFVYIIQCESSFNANSIHDGGHGKGVTGFWKETFERWNKKFFSGTLNYNSQEDQIKLMARVFAESEEYRNDWTSWNKYKKYGTCYNYEIKNLKKKAK